MENNFMEVRSEDSQQMFINLNEIASFKQAKGNDMKTEIMYATGHTVLLATQFHEFRKSLGLDKK